MKPHSTVRQLLGSPKDKGDKLEQAGVVYQIDCKECEASYIGQTGRHLKERLKEHKKALEKGDIRCSGVAEHAFQAHHEIDVDNIKVLDKESNFRKRLVLEALHIRQKAPSMNREGGLEMAAPFWELAKSSRGRMTPAPTANLQSS